MTRKLMRHGIQIRKTLGGWAGQVHGYKFRACRKRAHIWQINAPGRELKAKTLGGVIEVFIQYIESEVDQNDQEIDATF